MYNMLYQEILSDAEVLALLERGNHDLGVLGFTDHSRAHTALVADRAANILQRLGYNEHTQMLARVAGFMHDIGNAINRSRHGEYGALLAYDILKKYDLSMEDRLTVVSAIGNHDESTGGAKDAVSAALILADKSDVRRNRVRTTDREKFDIHDRVNYSVYESSLTISPAKTAITLALSLDTSYSEIAEYFEIFMDRMLLCKRAANYLHMDFDLVINNQVLL